MTGLSRTTFRPIDATAHLAQSVADILSTPKGTRVLNRTYGSDVPALLDRPMNGETLVDLYVAVADALDAWEPRLTLLRVQVANASAGHAELQLDVDVAGTSDTLTIAVGAAA